MPGTKRTFIITSVIYFSQNKLSYSTVRSIFTPAERTAQTIQTVKSIREKVPGADIILLEMGKRKNISDELINLVDKYVFVGNNLLVNWACSGKFKGLGEALGLVISKKSLKNEADFYFKISGRYFLNDDFRPEIWGGRSFFAKKYDAAISTRLYGFGKEMFDDWQKALRRSLLPLYKGRSIEEVFPKMLDDKNIHRIENLGVSGFVGPQGEYLAE
jgi:hypothetical protein